MNAVSTMTYAEEQAAKQAKKAERAWKKTMENATVYCATRVHYTVGVSGDRMLEKLKRRLDEMTARGAERMAKLANRLLVDAANALEWSREEFDAAGEQRVAKQLNQAVTMIEARGDEYDAPSSLKVVQIVRDQLYRDVLSGAKYPSRSSSAQSNEMEKSITAARAKLLEEIDQWMAFMLRGC